MKKYGIIIMAFLLFKTEVIIAQEKGSLVNGGLGIDSAGAVYNPAVAGLSSALFPGGGQFYTKHYIKAGTFLALEAITSSVTLYWYKTAKSRSAMALSLLDEAHAGSGIDSAKSYQDYLLMKNSVREADFKAYNALAWTMGGYFFNVLDAVGGSRFFDNDHKKEPRTAGWLAAIPGLGLGQLYNGSFSKAGLVIMTQVSLGVVAYNNHRLMRDAEKQISILNNWESKNDKNPDELKELNNEDALKSVISQDFMDDWAFRRRTAFQNRNTYLWYSIFFYFYGIFDAVVDAHLHDYKEKMRMSPDLAVYNGGAWLKLNMNF